VNVHLHFILSNLKRASKLSTWPTSENISAHAYAEPAQLIPEMTFLKKKKNEGKVMLSSANLAASHVS